MKKTFNQVVKPNANEIAIEQKTQRKTNVAAVIFFSVTYEPWDCF